MIGQESLYSGCLLKGSSKDKWILNLVFSIQTLHFTQVLKDF
jgi:hypothetical protein